MKSKQKLLFLMLGLFFVLAWVYEGPRLDSGCTLASGCGGGGGDGGGPNGPDDDSDPDNESDSMPSIIAT